MGASVEHPESDHSSEDRLSRPDPSSSAGARPRFAWLIVVLLLLPLFGAIWYTAVLAWNLKGRERDEALIDRDADRLRELIPLLAGADRKPTDLPLAADGRLDVFFIVRGVPTGQAVHLLDLLRSERYKTCPSLKEARSGDFHSYAYRRRRGAIPVDGPVPVLWDPGVDRRGERLVAYSDGAVRRVKESNLARQLADSGQS